MFKSKVFLTSCAVLALAVPSAHADEDFETTKANIVNTQGQIIGTITATEAVEGTVLRIEAKDVPEGWHALHVHQVSDCSDYTEGFKLSGSHLNPHSRQHGFLNEDGYENGDLPNVYAHADGTVMAEMHSHLLEYDDNLLDNGGTAIIMHESADDMKTQPIGGAGARIACAAFNEMED